MTINTNGNDDLVISSAETIDRIGVDLERDEAAKAARAAIRSQADGLAERMYSAHKPSVQKIRMRLGSPVLPETLSGMARESMKRARQQKLGLDEIPLPEGRFADRELSWLAFNERVLEQAEDRTLAILERAWFLAIFASNLDEFYMVRVAGLKRRIAAGMAVTGASGFSPHQVLDAILSRSH